MIVWLLACVLLVGVAPGAHATTTVPDWAKPALRHVVDKRYITRSSFYPNRRMTRSAFKSFMQRAFGGGYSRTKGYVKASEVDRALVRALGKAAIARKLATTTSPDGWDPEITLSAGFEVVARELGLRHDRPTSEDRWEASALQSMRQADIVYAVWKAKTAPSTYGADALGSFALPNYSATRRKVVKYALSLIGRPYVWGGEWANKTPTGYPYGAQVHGGFDCSGFVWYVLKAKTSSYSPIDRPYAGWSLPERSSSEMAKETRTRLGFGKLVPGDVLLFSPDDRAATVYHAGLYLGKGWMVHSSGSRAGPSIGFVGAGSWWRGEFAWGRRVIR